MNWVILAVIAPLMLAIFQILSKLLPGGVSVILVTAYASVFEAVLLFIAYFSLSGDKSLYLTTKTFVLSVGIGIFLALANFMVIKAYSLGAPQSSFSAIMYPLLVIYATFVGFFIWHEKINAWQLLGILLSIVGIILVFYFKDSSQLIK